MTPEQFWARVDQSGDCWLWRGTINSHGYGVFMEGRQVRAHRRAYELTYGPVPVDGETGEPLDVLHHCDNPPCVRPVHLFAGTALDNVQDMIAKGRSDFTNFSHHPGELDGNARLTWDQVRTIRSLWADGWRKKPIADLFGVTLQNISHVVAGKTWKENREN
jgi:hypothetical protein